MEEDGFTAEKGHCGDVIALLLLGLLVSGYAVCFTDQAGGCVVRTRIPSLVRDG